MLRWTHHSYELSSETHPSFEFYLLNFLLRFCFCFYTLMDIAGKEQKQQKKSHKLALVGIIPNQILFSSTPTKTKELTTRGCAVFFRLIRLSVLLSLSELKEKRIWLKKKRNPRSNVLKKISAYTIAPSSFTPSSITKPHHFKENAEYKVKFYLKKLTAWLVIRTLLQP